MFTTFFKGCIKFNYSETLEKFDMICESFPDYYRNYVITELKLPPIKAIRYYIHIIFRP